MPEELIGPMLARLRMQVGLSQSKVADRATCAMANGAVITRADLSRWERGVRLPSDYWLVPLADVLGAPIGELEQARELARMVRKQGRMALARVPRCQQCECVALARHGGHWLCQLHYLLRRYAPVRDASVRRGELWIAAGGVYARKPRPVLVVQDESVQGIESVTVCPVTSTRGGTTLTRVAVEPSAANGLKKVSFVMVDKITTVDRSNVPVRLGVLARELLGQVERRLQRFLGWSR